MKIFTTPMCQEVVRLAGVSEYTVKEDINFEGADLVITLSETETNTDTIKIKLNTFKQIYGSIDLISNSLGTEKINIDELKDDFAKYIHPELDLLNKRKKIKVKVYSNFIRDIVEDMGFTLEEDEPDFIVYPDYMKWGPGNKLMKEIESKGIPTVEIPSHKHVPLNPLQRAKTRYHILESRLCMKP